MAKLVYGRLMNRGSQRIVRRRRLPAAVKEIHRQAPRLVKG